MARETPLVALDVGTSKVCALIGEPGPDQTVKVLGFSESKSDGLRKGVIVNIERTIAAIQQAVEEAENQAGIDASSVIVGISGGHIKSQNSRGMTGVGRHDKEISQDDVKRAIEAAKAVAIPIDREVVHVIPYGFIIDGQDGIRDPVGMLGVRLEVDVHIITGAVTSVQNLIKSINRAGFDVDGIVLEPMASAESILTEDEKDLGVAMVDIGGGTSDIVIYLNGTVRHSEVVSLGGEHVTRDISLGLRTPHERAETIKRSYGCALVSMISNGQTIAVPSVGDRRDREVALREMVEIIEIRMDELMRLIQMEIQLTGYNELIGGGVVLTGGASLLPGIVEMTEGIFGCPVRIGKPRYIANSEDFPGLDSPAYATVTGLARHGLYQRGKRDTFGPSVFGTFGKLFERVGEWVRTNL
ncbi:MAG: cell division protein FtsA [Candidatus Abyssobacteria bacterium SURF_17]|uniref:Cell division protein FtsA n=1 Tax=Candidatus Abyssobacteria bacterium SURF_17 TaxID=2093361 RepID=A0A419F7N3_9BACT|nr:MAG: cell division protein FtsA [Candidatus Abyssubacteria bacterium SURF_17]